MSLAACVCLTWQDGHRAATGIRREWPRAQPLGVTTARWVGVALWEMEYIKRVLYNGRFLGSTEHQCYSTWHPHWKELQHLESGRCPGSVGRSELMVRSQLDVLKQRPLLWSRSPFLLAEVHQSNALWESRVIIDLSERQEWSRNYTFDLIWLNFTKTVKKFIKKAALSGAASKGSVFLWFLEKPVGVDGWISPKICLDRILSQNQKNKKSIYFV